MNADDFLLLLNKIENLYPVQHWSLADIPLWPVTRLTLLRRWERVGNIHENASAFNLQQHGLLRHWTRLRSWEKTRRIDRQNNQKISQPADALFLTATFARQMQLAGAWHDRFCDPLIDELGKRHKSSLVLELESGRGY